MVGLVPVDLAHFSAEAKYLADEIDLMYGQSLWGENLSTQRKQIARSVLHLRAIFASLEIEKCACRPEARKALFALRGRVRHAIKLRPMPPDADLAIFYRGTTPSAEYTATECDREEVWKRREELLDIAKVLGGSAPQSQAESVPLIPPKAKGGRPKKWGKLVAMIEAFITESNDKIACRYNSRFKAHRSRYGVADPRLVSKYRAEAVKNMKSRTGVT